MFFPRKTVYPRVGGETQDGHNRHVYRGGLSPRGRGNQRSELRARANRRSIPAWAGKPTRLLSQVLAQWVYPRVGGETGVERRIIGVAEGLSPRGRGNPISACLSDANLRSIPAWAGKPGYAGGTGIIHRVYPRVGGETSALPRGSTSLRGLSPRGRGNLLSPSSAVMVSGSIPAWAGKPSGQPEAPQPAPVYPRVGGETLSYGLGAAFFCGLSPRGRGNRESRPA